MIQEEALIPYQTSPLPEGPWLVFAPHPDDETFGMGGTLTLAAKKAVGVTLVVLTDGSMGGRGSGIRQDHFQSGKRRYGKFRSDCTWNPFYFGGNRIGA